MNSPQRRLSQLDAFFIAYQETSGVSMQVGAEVELEGSLERAAILRALEGVLSRWPQLG